MKHYTIKKLGRGEHKSRGSKFYSFSHPINDLEEYRHLISIYRSEYPEACHVCSAYRLLVGSRLDEQTSDDGEPKGSSGQPILNQLKRNDLVNVAAYVVRIFGGNLLGIPGLIDSYSTAALLSIDDSKKIEWKATKNISFEYSYKQKRIVDSIIKEFSGLIKKQTFLKNIFLEVSIEEEKIDLFLNKLEESSSGEIKPLLD